MASIVFQGLRSCLEPQATEMPPKSDNNGAWSFIKALENPSDLQKVKIGDVYVHPMVKRSGSALSTKSLEMCTEGLGSETGSESGDEFSSLSSEETVARRSGTPFFDRKAVARRGVDFPPPLTSISGSDGTVKVKHHREGGRLVMKAVCVSSCGTKFQSERTNGRLRLSLFRDCSVVCESGGARPGEVETEDEYVTEDEEEVAPADGRGWRWDMDGNRGKVGGEIGIGEVKRLTRCKEGGNGNKVWANWGSFWVAIS